MTELLIVDLLDERVLEPLRQALTGHFDQEMLMQDESLAALALVGQHPPKLRGVALTIMPDVPRIELEAHDVIVATDGQGITWELTDKGEEMAALLAAAVPERTAEQRARDAQELDDLKAEVKASLRKRQQPSAPLN
jgi:hypothetical protein